MSPVPLISFQLPKPKKKTKDPRFSSGPTRKHPQWEAHSLLERKVLGRSHRSSLSTEVMQTLFSEIRTMLEIPPSYKIGLIGGSASGAMEAALWNLLGEREVDVLVQGFFSSCWGEDVTQRLKLKNARLLDVRKDGMYPCLETLDFNRDIVLVTNGTTSGICLPQNGRFIPTQRQGLVIADITSSAFNSDILWEKFDVAIFPFQKGLGGEAQHGIIVLNERAQQRQATYTPPWPIPRIFNLTPESLKRLTINTPSMMVLTDVLNSLEWIKKNGGVAGMKERTETNYQTLKTCIEESACLAFSVPDETIRSRISVTFHIDHPLYETLSPTEQATVIQTITHYLEQESVAYDIHSFRGEKVGFRFWIAGFTNKEDIKDAMAWVIWAVQCFLETQKGK